MKLDHSTKTLTVSLYLLTCLVCAAFLGGCATVSKKQQDKNLREQYQEYQGHARAGQAAIKKKQYKKAIDQFSLAIAMSPFEASYYYYRGLAWYRKGNVNKAIEDFDNVLVLDSRWRLAYVYRGLCRMQSRKYEKAFVSWISGSINRCGQSDNSTCLHSYKRNPERSC
jgi:tetratricopeptide (TPR) repeat protein